MLRFKIGDKAKVIGDYSGHSFLKGETITILGIGSEYEPDRDCYLAASIDEPEVGEWYIDDAELASYTNGDYIRQMSNDELGRFFEIINIVFLGTKEQWVKWLEEPYEFDNDKFKG